VRLRLTIAALEIVHDRCALLADQCGEVVEARQLAGGEVLHQDRLLQLSRYIGLGLFSEDHLAAKNHPDDRVPVGAAHEPGNRQFAPKPFLVLQLGAGKDPEGRTIFTPAESFNPCPINLEDPQLYGVFPYPVARLGTPELEIGRNTFHYDPFKIRMDVCWGQTEIWAAKLGETEHARHLIVEKLRDASLRFPAFWGPGPDWVPDMDHGGAGAIGLQEMLMQTDDEKILLFPAWPKDWDVEAKLYAPFQTVVEIKAENGKLRELKITPESRRKDVVVLGGFQQTAQGV
jgi:hypothetical protein